MNGLKFEIDDPYEDDLILSGRDRGYHLIRIRSFFDSEEVGYVKAAYIPRSNWERLCPTPIHYRAVHHGWVRIRNFLEEQNIESDPIEFASLLTGRRCRSNREVRDLEEALEIIERVQDRQRPHYEHFERAIVDNPYVDYIRVYEDYRNHGIARAMYERMGQFLGDKGLTFRGSGCQSDAAALVWEKMVADPKYPTEEIVLEGFGDYKDKIRYRLNYRDFVKGKVA